MSIENREASDRVIYLKGLNGIRTIAAFCVLVSHLTLWASDLKNTVNENSLGPFGVTMFFALSGFLITYLLLKEKDQSNGKIAIRKFYVRRILRIWPLYFFYLFICLTALFVENNGNVSFKIVFLYVALMANVPMALNTPFPYIGHYWSLATEEQFYLFWPWLVRMKKELLVLFTFLGLFVALKLTCYFLLKNHTVDYFFDLMRFGCMAIGGLGAILFHKYRDKISFFFNPYVEGICWIVVGAVVINRYHLISILDQEIFSVIVTIIIINQCANNKVLISLDNKIFDFLGRISFGIYVYHPLIIFSCVRMMNSLGMQDSYVKTGLIYTIVIALTILTAYISYRYFESPFLKLRSKFAIVKTKNYKTD